MKSAVLFKKWWTDNSKMKDLLIITRAGAKPSQVTEPITYKIKEKTKAMVASLD